jgi:photosystem II stability/assembly factor-like uncharacterized protein
VDDKLGFACGGSGSLFKTEDGGQTWRRERAADSLAANLYEVVFTRAGLGFVLGNDGVLLRVRSGPPCVLALQSEGGVAV